jgi:SNW domain-containing protein 1
VTQLFILIVRDLRNGFICRFVPDKEFSGTDRTATRSGPVQFEKEEEDPFGLDQFLTQAKRASKRPKDDRDRRGGEERDKRKRRE